MTYSIFGPGGNLMVWFHDRAPALEYLARVAQADPEYAEDVFLFASDDETGDWVGDVIYASSVRTPA
jgi:hypothetical protein